MNLADLCSGYGGPSLALEPFGFETVLFAEIDPQAGKVLAHHWPDVPNLGDLRAIEWEPWIGRVDAISAGFPCQPFSAAGRQKGMQDERWLWGEIERAVRILRPRLVFLENVPGLLSVDRGGALNAVLSGLAALGYVGSWVCLRASDVGACHRRERLFILATDSRCEAGWEVSRGSHGDEAPDGTTLSDLARGSREDAAGLTLLPTPQANDGTGSRREVSSVATGKRPSGAKASISLRTALDLLPTPNAADAERGPDYARAGRSASGGDDLVTTAAKAARDDTWGRYAPAIARHELLFGREAPTPLEGKSLSAGFVEWMMGLPAGFVTDCGLSRTPCLRLLGNGWVVAQAQAAFRMLAGRLAA